MKRWLWILALLAVVGVTLAQQASRAQVPGQKPAPNPGDFGPGAQGATLRVPGADAPVPGPAIPPGLQGAWNAALLPNAHTGLVRTGGQQIALPPSNSVDINKDITIAREVGPWTILVMSYTPPRPEMGRPVDPEITAAKMAREFVTEWNSNPAYAKFKLKAYVFNYGAEEKLKEYKRVQELKQQQIEALNKMGLDGKLMPIRIQTVRIDEQTAVLLGGFRDFDAAMSVAKEIRKIKLDPDFVKRVKVDRLLAAAYKPDAPGRDGSIEQQVDQYLNPFTMAFPRRNPSVPKDQPVATQADEMKLLRHVNKDEPFSLLNTKKPFTLAVKQFNSQTKTETDAQKAKTFISQFDGLFGRKSGEWVDATAHNAHNLAEGLRKAKLDAYVLHCQCCSYVTVGSYNSPQDPELVQMQRFLETYFKAEGFRFLDMFERPAPMLVPGMAAK